MTTEIPVRYRPNPCTAVLGYATPKPNGDIHFRAAPLHGRAYEHDLIEHANGRRELRPTTRIGGIE